MTSQQTQRYVPHAVYLLAERLKRDGSAWLPSLAGEGRVVYQGRFGEVMP